MVWIIGTIILGISTVILCYTTYNLMRKDEIKEGMIIYQQEYIDAVSNAIELCDVKLKEIDNRGIFKADDEVGWIFKNILYIQGILNQYNLNGKNNPNTPDNPINSKS